MLIAEYFDSHVNPFWTILRQVGVKGAISKLDRRSDGEWNNSGDRPWDSTVLNDRAMAYIESEANAICLCRTCQQN